MKITVVMENTAPKSLCKEWGLSLFIEYRGCRYLLDTGASSRFVRNMRSLGISVGDVSAGILSHAHYDHANGMSAFFRYNRTAPFYLREGACENCYGKHWIFHSYVGIKRGVLKRFANRIRYVSGDFQVADGVYLIPHKTEGLAVNGERNHLYIRENRCFVPDSFAHEQSLVFDTDKGLVICNSCSHGGADVIVNEVARTFPGKTVYAILGGFHLFRSDEQFVRSFAQSVKKSGVQKVYTGHCTGLSAYRILQEELGSMVSYMTTGQVIEL